MLPLTFAGAGLPRRMDPARPGFPYLRHLSRSLPFYRSCPAQATAALSFRVKVSPLPPFTGERQTLKTFNFLQEETQNG